MNAKFIFSLLFFLLITYSCKNSNNVLSNNDKEDYPCNLDMENYDYSFGIEYYNTDLYRTPGTQSVLDDEYLEEIRETLGISEYSIHSISGIMAICNWFNQNFTFIDAGGSMVGVNNVNELYEIKTFYGCHSAALVISSVLRGFGFPAVMIETASVGWAYAYYNNTSQGFVGHVMTEVYISDKWILLDNDGSYIEYYDSMNPFISTTTKGYPYNQQGLFVYAKGIDTWDYTDMQESFTDSMMINFANNIGCFEEKFNSVNYDWEN